MSTTESENHLERGLSNRHIQLIAIGGTIGTGLFMGSGNTISKAGPSVIFVYMIIGAMLYFVLRAMGELLLSNLEYKSFADFAGDILGPWAAYFTGWTRGQQYRHRLRDDHDRLVDLLHVRLDDHRPRARPGWTTRADRLRRPTRRPAPVKDRCCHSNTDLSLEPATRSSVRA